MRSAGRGLPGWTSDGCTSALPFCLSLERPGPRQLGCLVFGRSDDTRLKRCYQLVDTLIAVFLENPMELPVVTEHGVRTGGTLQQRLDWDCDVRNDRLELLWDAARLGEIGDNEASHSRQQCDRFSDVSVRRYVEI